MPKQGEDFSDRCISLDLEVGVENGKIHAFAAVRPDTGQSLRYPSGLNITISGKAGDDAKHYQIRDVKQVIEWANDEKD